MATDKENERSTMTDQRIMSYAPASEAYTHGVNDRLASSVFRNPYEKGTIESREYYEGWCERNCVIWIQNRR